MVLEERVKELERKVLLLEARIQQLELSHVSYKAPFTPQPAPQYAGHNWDIKL